jgi:hypothetical protein
MWKSLNYMQNIFYNDNYEHIAPKCMHLIDNFFSYNIFLVFSCVRRTLLLHGFEIKTCALVM